MSNVLISYRREDSWALAGRLNDRLVQAFGRESVFMDVDTIEPGVDFVEAIDKALSQVDVVVAVIGKDWLAISDAEGNRRLDNPEDFVRREIAIALERDIRVVPLLMPGAAMPGAADLPENLKDLTRRNAIETSATRFDKDVEGLIETLVSGGVPRAKKKQAVVGIVGLVLVAALAFWGYSAFTKGEGNAQAKSGDSTDKESEGKDAEQNAELVEEVPLGLNLALLNPEGKKGLMRLGPAIQAYPPFMMQAFQGRLVLAHVLDDMGIEMSRVLEWTGEAWQPRQEELLQGTLVDFQSDGEKLYVLISYDDKLAVWESDGSPWKQLGLFQGVLPGRGALLASPPGDQVGTLYLAYVDEASKQSVVKVHKKKTWDPVGSGDVAADAADVAFALDGDTLFLASTLETSVDISHIRSTNWESLGSVASLGSVSSPTLKIVAPGRPAFACLNQGRPEVYSYGDSRWTSGTVDPRGMEMNNYAFDVRGGKLFFLYGNPKGSPEVRVGSPDEYLKWPSFFELESVNTVHGLSLSMQKGAAVLAVKTGASTVEVWAYIE